MVTRKDVANKAGVSVTIVSRTLNNSGYVAKEKRELVLRAASELGYRPNPVALSLHNRRTKQILYYNKDLSNAFNIEMYRGMVKYARQHDYMIVLSGTLDVDKIKTMMIDGIILPNESIVGEYVNLLKPALKIPAVSATYGIYEKNLKQIPFVESDTYNAMEILINHLREKGHEKIALATPYELYISQPRHVAYISLMRSVLGNDIEKYVLNNCKISDMGAFEEENYFKEGEEIAKEFVRNKSDATAIVCFNDDLALGLCKQFRIMGIDVPNDVSVVGIDGISTSKYITPSLTTVDLSPFEQGAKCVEILLNMIEGKRVKYLTPIEVKLREGESVKDLTQIKTKN